jgi:beta-galactosidase
MRGMSSRSHGLFLFFISLPLIHFAQPPNRVTPPAAVTTQNISTAGWRLWPDRVAPWKDDPLYLPGEVKLDKMAVNTPTGGWSVLSDRQGIPVTLPSTVEEHFWGKWGTRPYTKNEAQRGAGTSFENGNYLGVSWWWRRIRVPDFKPGQRVVLRFRGARLRAEVYCNRKLCGYSIMEELPFGADITDAVKPGGEARLAVRITNPGGHLDWIDFSQMQIRWGNYTLPPSHGFGGLDEDIELAVVDNAAVTDIAAINDPDLHTVHLVAEVSSVDAAYDGPVRFSISRKGVELWHGSQDIQLRPGERRKVVIDARVAGAREWNLKEPVLYEAKAFLPGRGSSALAAAGRSVAAASGKAVRFGFRFFTAEGIGTDAMLTLNHKRIVPVSAISWGYWGRNGLWPDAAMAQREVDAAKRIGLNTLQCHRNIGKPAVLDIQDREGLLRNEEPGGGKFVLGARYARGPFGADGNFLAKDEGLLPAFEPVKGYVAPDTVDVSGAGPDGDGKTFWERYEEEKILEMVKRDRSHPSLVMYTIQNEANEMDLRNPRIYRLLREMHALDPSRIIVFYSGGNPKSDQVLMLPNSDEIGYAGKNRPYAGWQDVHTCGGPCNYLDFLYKDPQHFSQRQNPADGRNISEWGEMLGAATPDNYDQLLHSFDKTHPTGYEKADMQQILEGYHRFLDKWGFRKAFPTDSSLFTAIGYRTYYFWRRIIEQGRMDNTNDYLVVSGWESTTIDNHSGLVDNHRFFKSDPSVIAAACKPEILVIQPRHMIVARGGADTVDLFLINETNRKGTYRLKVTVRRTDGSVAHTEEREAEVIGGKVYGQLLTEGIRFDADAAGMMKIEASMTASGKEDAGEAPLSNTDEINVVMLDKLPLLQNIAVLEPGSEIGRTLKEVFHVNAIPWNELSPSSHPDAIVLATGTGIVSGEGDNGALFTGAHGNVAPALLDSILEKVKGEGTRLILWPDDERGAEAFAKALAERHIVEYTGLVGNLNAPWFGSWFFVRKHWLLDGLPVNCAMDWRYGVSAFGGPQWLEEKPRGTSTEGLLLDGPGIEAAIGFGADHNIHVGISGCVIPYGKGQILLYCLPQMIRSLGPGDFAINRVVCERLLGNALSARK